MPRRKLNAFLVREVAMDDENSAISHVVESETHHGPVFTGFEEEVETSVYEKEEVNVESREMEEKRVELREKEKVHAESRQNKREDVDWRGEEDERAELRKKEKAHAESREKEKARAESRNKKKACDQFEDRYNEDLEMMKEARVKRSHEATGDIPYGESCSTHCVRERKCKSMDMELRQKMYRGSLSSTPRPPFPENARYVESPMLLRNLSHTPSLFPHSRIQDQGTASNRVNFYSSIHSRPWIQNGGGASDNMDFHSSVHSHPPMQHRGGMQRQERELPPRRILPPTPSTPPQFMQPFSSWTPSTLQLPADARPLFQNPGAKVEYWAREGNDTYKITITKVSDLS